MQVSPYQLPTKGVGNLALVFLDWDDMPGSETERGYYLEQAQIMADWFSLLSQGKYSINWRVSQSWYTLPGSWRDWKRGTLQGDEEEDPAANQALLDAAVDVSDEDFDYSDIDYVIFAIPRSGSLTEQGAEIGDVVFYSGMHGFESSIHPNPDWRATSVNSSEGAIGNWALAGTTFQDDEGRSPAWIFWAHEMGHMFGFISHTYQPIEGNTQWHANPMTPGGLFAHQWYQVRAVSGWTSWVAGWLEDEQVQCVDSSEVSNEVFAINNRRALNGQTKMVILRTGPTTGLAIESREWDSEIDPPSRKAADGFYDGVLMYHIDSSRPLADQSLIPLMPHGVSEVWDSDMWPGPAVSGVDSMFQEGESAEYENLKIEVLSMQEGVDYVRVSRITN
jgi:M6 family metalloprotease-like protein